MYPKFSGSSSSMIRDAYSSACSLSFANLFADALSIKSCVSNHKSCQRHMIVSNVIFGVEKESYFFDFFSSDLPIFVAISPVTKPVLDIRIFFVLVTLQI